MIIRIGVGFIPVHLFFSGVGRGAKLLRLDSSVRMFLDKIRGKYLFLQRHKTKNIQKKQTPKSSTVPASQGYPTQTFEIILTNDWKWHVGSKRQRILLNEIAH